MMGIVSEPGPLCLLAFTLLCGTSAITVQHLQPAHLLNAPRSVEASRKLLQEAVTFGTFGFDEDGQEKSVHPGDDFFTFANGKAVENMVIPGDEASWGSFQILAKKSRDRVKSLLEDDVKAGGKMGKYYSSYMNEKVVNDLDFKPIQPMLEKLKAMKTATDFARVSGQGAGRTLLPAPFSIMIEVDDKDVSSYCVGLSQGGALGMPRDYYLKDMFAGKRGHYAQYAAKLLGMIHWPDAEKASKDILALETSIAKASWSPSEARDPEKAYNPVANAAALHDKAPGFDWEVFLKEAGDLPGKSKLIVRELGGDRGVPAIAKILGQTDMDILKSWATFHLVSGTAPALSERFVNASFEYSKVMSGLKEMAPRWKRAVNSADMHLGDAIGQLYVQKYFPASAKLQVQGLTKDLKAAFRKRLQKSDWMAKATKQKAIDKLDSFSIEVGYPDKFRNYDDLFIDEKDLFGNIERSIAFRWKISLGKLGKPVDRKEWSMTPQTVNAYNMPVFNQVVFPAAILQPPFFDPEADMAINYGAIGGVIGHEMTHGFDDQGRKFNAKGKLEDWWTDQDAQEFNRRAAAYDKQFVEYDLGVPNAHVKANLTTGEDLADLGGLTMALEAYKSHVASKSFMQLESSLRWKGASAEDDSEGVRRVFLGYAQVWRQKQRPDALLHALASDPHPPACTRVDIPMRNIAAWYDAFDVKEGQKNYLPEGKRVTIW